MNKNKLKKRLVELVTKTVVMTGRLKQKFLTVHTRPMYAKNMPYQAERAAADESCAILLQGPIKKEYRFTLETVKIYLKQYPAAIIILSTWEDEDTQEFENLAASKSNVKIVRTPKPGFGGPGNVNMQVASTLAGIKCAKDLGLAFVCKTRTDQRMYGIKNLQFLINMLNIFPLAPGIKQKKRIVGINITTTLRYTPYHLSDTWMFGTTQDLFMYWDFGYVATPALDPRRPLIERSLFINFLKKTNWDIKDTMEDFLKALGERCIVVGNESIDLYWPKYYERFREYRIRDYQFPDLEISLKEWFNKAFMPSWKKGLGSKGQNAAEKNHAS